MSLAFPWALAALAALLLPLLIHLRKRAQTERVDFAALRWLQARLRPHQQLRWSERGLMLVRLLLLALLALWLAQPQLQSAAAAEDWVVVAPGVFAQFPAATAKHEQRRWLAPGFPALTEPRPPARQPIASLLRELDAALPVDSKLTVVLSEYTDGFDGERLRLSREVRWQVAREEEQERETQGAQSEAEPQSTSTAGQALALAVRTASDRLPATRYLDAAVRAWNTPESAAASAPEPIRFDLAESIDVPTREARWLVWLHPGELPAPVLGWVRDGGVLLLEARTPLPPAVRAPIADDAQGKTLLSAQRLGAGRILQLAGELSAQTLPDLLDARFPAQLRSWLDGHALAPRLAASITQAPIADLPAWPVPPRPLQPSLSWLLLALFALERWLASAPHRRVDA